MSATARDLQELHPWDEPHTLSQEPAGVPEPLDPPPPVQTSLPPLLDPEAFRVGALNVRGAHTPAMASKLVIAARIAVRESLAILALSEIGMDESCNINKARIWVQPRGTPSSPSSPGHSSPLRNSSAHQPGLGQTQRKSSSST